MASIKTINFLPSVFRSDTNQKFLNATLDQLVTPPDLRKVNGYIGRTNAPTFNTTDNYQPEPTALRTNYQLEPSVVVKNAAGNVDFFSSYIDLLKQIEHEGGFINNQSRLFQSESYSFDGLFDFDKLVNFNQYYWLSDGPDAVDVFGTNVDTEREFVITRDPVTGTYNISGYGTLDNPTLKLAYGGVYTFVVDQPGFPFWIQSFPGVNGTRPRQDNITTRTVLGVDNNGTDQGIITFRVPQPTAQDYYTRMPLVATVDLSTDLSYSVIQNQLLSTIVDTYGGMDSVTSQLLNKTIIFTNLDIDDSLWTENGVTVPVANRRDAWRINLIDNGSGDFIFNLQPSTQIATNQKAYVRGGLASGEKTFYYDPDAEAFLPVPDLTATATRLYYQDGVTGTMVGGMDMVRADNSTINVSTEIVGQKNYTSPNGVTFTNGLKVRFDSSAIPESYFKIPYITYTAWQAAIIKYGADRTVGGASQSTAYKNSAVVGLWDGTTGVIYPEYYVEGVGSAIRLIPTVDLLASEDYAAAGLTEQDYITINRSSLDLNAWSRSNRWFHIDVIEATAEYNNTTLLLDQSTRAKRPIIEFDADLQLFNYGRLAKAPIDIFYNPTTPSDAFEEVELQNTYTLDGVYLEDGMRVIFANDEDPNVKDNIYVINIESIGGNRTINLVLADDYDVQPYNNLVVLQGSSQGKVFYYTGSGWQESTVNAKTGVNQEPLFDVVDINANSLGDTDWYPNSDFTGTKIFSYKPGTGANDSVLGFPLSYRNFNQIGDIQFENNFDSDTFGYEVNTTDAANTIFPINNSLLIKRNSLTSYTFKNIWVKHSEESKQFQIIQGIYNGTTNLFEIDVTVNTESFLPYLRVYKNSKLLAESQYTLTTTGVKKYIEIDSTVLAANDYIDILVYSNQVSSLGYYEIPKNLDYNTENKNFTSLTLGQIRNHLVTIVENSNNIVGPVPGSSNIRDLVIKQQGGSIVQHASPVLYSEIFLVDENVNFLKGLNLARHEYTNIKNKFLELALSTPDLDLSDAVASTDALLQRINAVKNRSFPWYYSDMVPYGNSKNVISYRIINAQIRGYEISEIFNDRRLSNRSVLIYINNVQLVKGQDFVFDTDRAGITILDTYQLGADDLLTIVEYENTDGNFIPETPSKLGLYPKFRPAKYLDNTYQDPIQVIQGHDGSITPAFGDFRDDLLLEFEKRIYNNIKIDYQQNSFNVIDYIPGKFRRQDYSFAEFNRLLTAPFLKWVGGNRVDFTSNLYFDSSNPWTWNYRRFRDATTTSEPLTGAWRSIFKYFYDTDRPHTHPWEMLGFSEQPDWWIERYGPAPYTGGNLVLWGELAQGYIHAGARAGYDSRYARSELLNFIPVDEYGNLRSPEQFLTTGFNSNDANASYAVGDQGPVETAWRRSSDYPFAVQQAIALSRPGYYFGSLMSVDRYYKNDLIGQYALSDTLGRITPAGIAVNGDATGSSVVRSAGYVNWVAEYLRNQGINPAIKIRSYLDNVQVQLAYKMAGYSDKSFLQVIAEQSSPTSTNSGVVIPAENYNLSLYKSTPVDGVVYSAVIVERTANGYTVSGYNQDDPYFTIIPSIANNNAYGITINQDTGVIYNDFQKYKLTVPYGYEFTTKQQVVDFLISYERYLRAKGFGFNAFDADLELQRDFKLSVREFLVWSQQGWTEDNLIVLSPVLDRLTMTLTNGTIDEIVNIPDGSRILDTNFAFIRNNQFTVTRTDNRFTLTANFGQTIALAVLDVVEYEHVLIFDNTTVFNDIIYKPELGNRQYRLKLVGSKTGNWTGELNPPGFIYNSPTVEEWTPGTDYNKGSLISYKSIYYVALTDLVATTEFVFGDWSQISSDQIKSGLLPNFSYNAQRFNNLFDIDNPEPTLGQEDFSQRLIGFSPRQYMTDFGIDKTTQAKFYQGYIKEKGTLNAINAFTAAGFNGVTSTINLYEEWAMRVGEYGALENNQYVEVTLREDVFTGDPSTFTLLPNGGSTTDRIIGITPSELYRTAPGYDPEVYLNRDSSSIYENDIRTAGYVSEGDVDTTIFDIGNYRSLNAILDEVSIGYKIWVAKDFDDDWNVYRVYETNTLVTTMNYSVDNVVEVITKKPHGFLYADLIVIKGFNDSFDGFYQIVSINGAFSFSVIMADSTLDFIKSLQTVTDLGPVYRLTSVRLKTATDISTITPVRPWRDNDKLWVDDAGEGTWAVYNKSTPWIESNIFSSSMQLNANTYVTNSGYGEISAIRSDGKLAAASTTGVMNGNVLVFTSNLTNGNVLTQFANIGTTDTVTNFGSSLDIKGNLLYVGTPGNGTTHYGRVYVYQHDGNVTLTPKQTITSNWGSNTGNKFGQSISASADNKWLFIGAPNKGNVEVFHANANNYYTYANTISVGSYANTAFGSLVKTTSDASQTIIAAPYESVSGVSAAGAVYVYDRSIETYLANGVQTAFITQNPINTSTVRVTVNGIEQTSGFTANATAVTFTSIPVIGNEISIETSKFQWMEKLTAPAPTSGAGFGTSADITGNDADIYVSSPGYSEPNYHSGVVYRFVNTGERYGEVTGTVFAPTVTAGDSIRINGRLVTFSNVYLANVVADINSTNIVGITATATQYNTLSITSNINSQVDKLVITPGNNGNVLANLGITVYTNIQTIQHLPQDDINRFGTKVAVASSGNSLVITGPGSTTYNSMVIDSEQTLLDQGSTSFLDPIPAAGVVYVYGLVDSALSGTAEDQMVFVQRLQNARLTAYDQFGSSIAVSDNTLLVGAPGDDSAVTVDPLTDQLVSIGNTGTFYTYYNISGNVGWDIVNTESPKVDIYSVTRMYLFDTVTNSILTDLDHIDPAKGKLLGVAEQDIDFWTAYDPAVYNVAGSTDYVTNDVSVNADYHWGANQLGKTWWNLSLVKFLDYEQGSLNYRANNWGELFPGSEIQIAEWVVSDSIPSQYTGDGDPLYPVDNSSYVTETYVDSATKIIRSRYYFWVINKTSVNTNQTPRTNSIVTLENMISNPHAEGIPYAAVLRNDTVSLYNVSNYISGNTTVLHIDFDSVKNDNIIHSEYQLVQEGNTDSIIPERIVNKLRDSLAGRDQFNTVVPDPALTPQSRVGIDRGQSIFVNRIAAVKNWVAYVNNVLAATPVVNDFIIDRLYSAEPLPSSEDYDLTVNSYEELGYINVNSLNDGFVVLVKNDETQQGLWSTYTFNIVDEDTAIFSLTSTQSYYTPFYWDTIDWFEPGSDSVAAYDPTVKPTYQVATIADLQTLTLFAGNTVKVLNNGKGQWEIYRYDNNLVESLVGIQGGTIQLNSNLWDGSATSQYEIRIIFDTLQNDIFKEGLAGKFNEMFFFLINYILSEQKTVDWIFKTSFVSIVHQLRKLEQFPNYIRDNQTYYESYINEVKPYRTSLREYLLDYQGDDTYEHNVTDFDIPSTYDSELLRYRSPDLTLNRDDTTLSTNPLYTDWYNNYGYGIGSVTVVQSGATDEIDIVTLGITNAAATITAGDYITQPSTGANGRAYINSIDSTIQLTDVTGAFTNIIGTLYLNVNANVYVGNTIVQLSTGSYGDVYATSTGNVVLLSNVVGNFGNTGNAYLYRDGANLVASVSNVSIDNAYIFKNGGNLQVNVDVINFYTVSSGGYYETPKITVTGGGGSGANIIAHIDPIASTISRFEVINPGSGYTSQPTIEINGTGTGAVGYAHLVGQYYIESVPTKSLTLSSNISLGEGNIVFQPNSASQGTLYTTVNNSNVITVVDTVGAFNTGNWLFTADSNLATTVTAINSFTQFVDKSYNKVRTFNSNLKFDRVSYQSIVMDWASNSAPVKSGNVVRYDGKAYQALSNAYENLTLSGSITTNAGNIIHQWSTGINVVAYASATSSAVIKVRANTINGAFSTLGNAYLYDLGNVGYPANVNLAVTVSSVTTANSYVYSTTTMKLSGNITANVGQYITQANATGNATVVASITGNVVTVSNVTGEFRARGGNLSVNGSITSVRPATVNNIFDYEKYTQIGSGDFDNANDRIMGYYSPTEGMPGRDLPKLVQGLEYPGVQIQGVEFGAFSSNITSNILSYHHNNLSLISSNVSVFDFTTTEYAAGEYITVANLDLSPEDNLRFKIVNITNNKLLLAEVSGGTFSISQGSNVALKYYDFNDTVYLDSSIQSAYLDSELGTRAEDINVDGGAYYDTFSSHAPEELVPGQTFDHLNMSVYTKIFSNTQIIGFRIIANALTDSSSINPEFWPQYYKIANASVLTANLNLTDTAISVANASAFTAPSVALNRPGTVYINGEKIVYWRNYATEAKTAWSANTVITSNSLITYSGNTYLTSGNVYAANFANIAANVTLVDNNTLAQIRRGAEKTGAPLVHIAGSTVEEISTALLVPSVGTSFANVHLGTWQELSAEAQRYIVTDETSGEYLVTESNTYITTTSNPGAFLLGLGLEQSESVQAVFLRGA